MPGFSFGKKICQWCVRHEAYERGELADEAPQPVMAAPWIRRESGVGLTQILFGANVAVFLGMAFATSSPMDFPGGALVHWGANVGPYTLSGQWWRLFTYMFLHGGIMHIAFNMWCLWDLGTLCESLYGRWTFGAIYLITGVGGGLASVAWNPGVLSVGASGAIFGLAGALIASFYLGEFSLPRSALSGTLRSLVFFAGFNLFFGGLFRGIDNACHIGGLVTGLILGALIARVAPDHDNILRRATVLGVVALALVGSAWGVQRWRGFARAGRNSLSENTPQQMIAHLQEIVRQRPDFVAGHVALAKAYFSQGQFDAAETEMKRAAELDPKNAAVHLELGNFYLSQNRPQDAKDTFTQLLAQNANDADAHYGLGLALADQENHKAAIEEFKTAARLDPKAAGVNYNLGVSYAKLKMYDDAIAAFLKEQAQNGDDYEIEAGLAEAYQSKGMTQQAQEARSKAEQLKDGER